VLYQRVSRLFADLALARGDGRYATLMRALGGVKLLILDDWGLEPHGPQQWRELLEIAEERHGRGATLITSQIPVDQWHHLVQTEPEYKYLAATNGARLLAVRGTVIRVVTRLGPARWGFLRWRSR